MPKILSIWVEVKDEVTAERAAHVAALVAKSFGVRDAAIILADPHSEEPHEHGLVVVKDGDALAIPERAGETPAPTSAVAAHVAPPFGVYL